MKIYITGRDVEMPIDHRDDEGKCRTCGGPLDWKEAHSVADCIEHLRACIDALRSKS